MHITSMTEIHDLTWNTRYAMRKTKDNKQVTSAEYLMYSGWPLLVSVMFTVLDGPKCQSAP